MKIVSAFAKIKEISFIELLVSSLLVEFIILFFLFFISKTEEVARDSIRKKNISQVGRIITNPCFVPQKKSKKGEYDLSLVLKEIIKKDEIYQSSFSQFIKDPKSGNNQMSMYIYKISKNNHDCVIYANLESNFNKETLNLNRITPGGGVGIIKYKNDGWNGSPFYFQYSN